MSSKEYLNHVLKNWGAFCKTHRNIKKAIEDCLEENARLKVRIKELENFNGFLPSRCSGKSNFVRVNFERIRENAVTDFTKKLLSNTKVSYSGKGEPDYIYVEVTKIYDALRECGYDEFLKEMSGNVNGKTTGIY